MSEKSCLLHESIFIYTHYVKMTSKRVKSKAKDFTNLSFSEVVLFHPKLKHFYIFFKIIKSKFFVHTLMLDRISGNWVIWVRSLSTRLLHRISEYSCSGPVNFDLPAPSLISIIETFEMISFFKGSIHHSILFIPVLFFFRD